MSDTYQWIECASCGNLYPVGGRSGTDPVETSPENAEHHDQNCPIRAELETRGQTADRDVGTETDRNGGDTPDAE